MAIYPDKAGSKFFFNGEFCGDFTAEIAFSYSGTVYFNFDDGNNSFDIGFENGTEFNVFVRIGDEKAGVYYLGDANVGNTSVYNANGEYTQFAKNRKYRVSFDFSNMNVYCDDGENDYLVWRLGEAETAGREISVIQTFGKYSVSVLFENAYAENPLYIFSVNGTSFGGETVNYSVPVLGATKTHEAINGINYIVPVPFARDFAEGELSDITVKVYDSFGNTVLDESYSQSTSFLPSAGSHYIIEYSAVNGKGLKGIYNLYVQNFASETETGVVYDLDDVNFLEEYGVGSSVYVPEISVSSKAVVIGVPVYYMLKVNGAVKDGFEKVSALNSSVIMAEVAGAYEIVWFTEDDSITVTASRSFDVKDGKVGLITDFNKKLLPIGYEVNIPASKISYDGKEYVADSKVIFPSGNCFANPRFSATEKGLYEIVFSAITDEGYREISAFFTVADSAETLFSGSENSTFEFGHSNVTSKVKGVHVTTKNSETVTYNNIINLNNLTRNDLLIELMADVKKIGAPDFNAFDIILTDIYDAQNFVKINCMFSQLTNSNGNGTYIKTAASNGQVLAGWYGGTGTSKNIQTMWGYDTQHSFIGKSDSGDISKNTLKLYWDNSELRLYSGPVVVTGGNTGEVQDYLVMDYDDSTFQVVPWNGFTTGEVYLSISVSGAQYLNVGYTISAINGISLDKLYYSNNKKPSVTLETEQVPF
ncbi:MAG: hypothetical protein J6Y43_06685, partial [Clostridia bacterium]|nr:hypothetical protein [Clostridia bacterium]